MTREEIAEAAGHFGKRCSFEKLVANGSTEHNGLRYENIIPWSSDQDEWVKQETRITGSTLHTMETCQIRNLVIFQDRPAKASPNSILEVIRKLDESIPVVWDRFTKTDDGFHVVYGWIARNDGQRDFIIFEMWDYETPENAFCTTSSAKFSRQISEILYGNADDHNDCRKIDELYTLST